jgi:hypothetical protein
MLHHHRRFAVTVVSSMVELTEKLTEHTWTLCTCFEYDGLLLANDSFSGDGAQEYAVYKEGCQIETLTVSWMTRERLQEVIEALLQGEYTEILGPVAPLHTEHASAHSCGLCQ